jgi:hypothetical protein
MHIKYKTAKYYSMEQKSVNNILFSCPLTCIFSSCNHGIFYIPWFGITLDAGIYIGMGEPHLVRNQIYFMPISVTWCWPPWLLATKRKERKTTPTGQRVSKHVKAFFFASRMLSGFCTLSVRFYLYYIRSLRAASASNQLKISETAPRMHIRFYGTPSNRTFTREAAIKIIHSLFWPIFRRDSPARSERG